VALRRHPQRDEAGQRHQARRQGLHPVLDHRRGGNGLLPRRRRRTRQRAVEGGAVAEDSIRISHRGAYAAESSAGHTLPA
jgi:hypothetical protein